MPEDLNGFALALPSDLANRDVEAWLRSFAPGKAQCLESVRLTHKNGTTLAAQLGLHRVYNRKREISRAVGFACPLPGESLTEANAQVLPDALANESLHLLSEGVLVMDEDEAVRTNRLRLLGRIVDRIEGVADLSRIAAVEEARA